MRGKRGDFKFEGSGALLSEINPRTLIHRCHVKSLKSLRSLEVNEKHHQNSGGKEGKFSISRVVGSNFPKNTPGECSIEDTYQIWRSYSDEKLVKIVTKIKGGEDEKGEKLNSEGGRVQFSEKHPWGMFHRSCIPNLKILRRWEVG